MRNSFSASRVVPSVPLPLYALSLRMPGFLPIEIATYTFPISPSVLRREPRAMTATWDTQAPTSTSFGGSLLSSFLGGSTGVARVVDQYGIAPPVFMIEGTTGLGYHGNDKGLLTGLQSVKALDALITLQATLNQAQSASGSGGQLYTLEFYDFFMSEFWQVVVDGNYGFWQAKDKPEQVQYRFRFLATRNLSAPVEGLIDLVLATLTQPVEVAAASFIGAAGLVVSNYTSGGF